jgi:non-heme chloroperoxidase
MAIGGVAIAVARPARSVSDSHLPHPPVSQSSAAAGEWRDPSPHVARMVRTAPGARLEVLDWGGDGPPLVFLAGFGNTAHVFDGFAPRFAGDFRVIGITRRGFGASCCPAAGYDSATLAADILAVLDTLGIARASFAAHSFGGSELNWLAVHAPERVDRLVYIDAGSDFARLYATSAWVGGRSPRPPLPDGYRDRPGDVAQWLSILAGPGYPESEVRALHPVAADGTVGDKRMADSIEPRLRRGTPPAELRRIQAPVLAFYAVPRTAAEKYPWWTSMDADERREAEHRFAVEARVMEGQRARFRAEVPRAEIVEVPGGRHYLFLTHPDLVAERMRRFLLRR